MFPALGAVVGLLHPVAGGVLRSGLKFQTCTNTLNKFFLTIPGIFGSPYIYIYIYMKINTNIIIVMTTRSSNFNKETQRKTTMVSMAITYA